MTKKNRATLLVGLSLLGLFGLAMLIGIALQQAWPELFPEVVETAEVMKPCDLRQGPCRALFADGSAVTFSIEPRDIPLVRPLMLGVELEGVAARSAEVDFVGLNMDMGFNRAKLADAVGRDGFRGEGVLPICIARRMDWEARVMLETDRGLLIAPFRFHTTR